MTLQEWLAASRYADSLPMRLAAYGLKAVIEGGFLALLLLPVALGLDAGLSAADLQVLGLRGSWVLIWVVLTGSALAQQWCFTTDRRAEESEE